MDKNRLPASHTGLRTSWIGVRRGCEADLVLARLDECDFALLVTTISAIRKMFKWLWQVFTTSWWLPQELTAQFTQLWVLKSQYDTILYCLPV